MSGVPLFFSSLSAPDGNQYQITSAITTRVTDARRSSVVVLKPWQGLDVSAQSGKEAASERPSWGPAPLISRTLGWWTAQPHLAWSGCALAYAREAQPGGAGLKVVDRRYVRFLESFSPHGSFLLIIPGLARSSSQLAIDDWSLTLLANPLKRGKFHPMASPDPILQMLVLQLCKSP